MDAQRLARIARRQSGLFTRSQARACGFSQYQIRRRLACGDWKPIAGPVLAYRGVTVTPWIRDRAAQMSVAGSVLAGPSAARTWNIRVPDDRSYLLIGAHGRCRLPGVRVLYEMADPRDVGLYNGVPVTSLGRTVVDCLRILPDRAAADLLDRSLQQGWITVEEFAERIGAIPGRAKVGRLRRLLRGVEGGARSAAERVLTGLLRDAAITGWRANAPICDDLGVIGIGDVVFDHVKLVIEVDGLAFHTTPDRFQHDRVRQNRLVAAGWTVLRFTWRDVTERPEYVIAMIRSTLARLAHSSDQT